MNLLVKILSYIAHSAKARTVHRRKIVNLKVRSDKLIAEMKDKYGVIVTEEHKKSGIFPWHNSVGTNVNQL